MADWINNTNGIITLITGLLGLIGTGIGTFFAVKNWVNALKTKSFNEIWNMIVEMADKAMREVEKTAKSGADKKQIVMETVKAGCLAGGIDMSAFVDQLSDYIDQTIVFVNDMKSSKAAQ